VNLSREHLVTVTVIVIAIATLVAAARLRPGRWTGAAAVVLGLVILGNELGWWVWEAVHHSFDIGQDLPLFPCDVIAFVAPIALWWRNRLAVELTYFWGIAGTANGVISPDISNHFPDYQFLQYNLQHGAIPAAALFLVVGLGITPRPWAVAKALGLAAALMFVDAFANLLTGGNYMFLRQVPPGQNLLDLFGPWPWYIGGGALLAFVFFAVLEAPFRISALARGRSRTGLYPPPA
jgi:hypothetical integral membrane protein (TIGR02206 family)